MKWICRDCGDDWSPDRLLCPSCGSPRGQTESGRVIIGTSGKDLFPDEPDPTDEIEFDERPEGYPEDGSPSFRENRWLR